MDLKAHPCMQHATGAEGWGMVHCVKLDFDVDAHAGYSFAWQMKQELAMLSE